MSESENKIFEEIKKDIEKDELDKDVNDRMLSAFATKFRMGYVTVFAAILVLSGLLIWCAVEFYYAENLYDRIFWGIHFAVVLTLQAFTKLWFWLEMNRVSVLRNIKRLELEITLAKDRVG